MKNRLTVKVTAKQVYRRELLIRICKIGIALIFLFLSVAYGILYIVNKSGNFTISLDPNLYKKKGIVISKHQNFDETSIILKAKSLEYMDNISGNWIPEDIDSREGEQSKDNYLAYTFFVRNDGEDVIDYKTFIDVKSVINNVDEAIRVAVYTNGEKKVYAKRQKNSTEPEPNTISFVSNTRVMEQARDALNPGDVDKYTVVIWLEGDDPECVDDILGGEMKMLMLIEENLSINNNN